MNILDRIQSLIDYELEYMEQPECDAIRTDLNYIYFAVEKLQKKANRQKELLKKAEKHCLQTGSNYGLSVEIATELKRK